jgi:Tol biopolymer transport system component
MDPDGANIRQLTSPGFADVQPSVTSDGRYIVFESNRGGSNEVWRVQNDGSDLRQLTTGGGNTDPHPTPDGKWVVYISTRDGRSLIWRIPIEGGESARVTDRDSFDPRVSPDGKLIACGYRTDNNSPLQLAIVAMEDGKPVNLFDVPPSANFNQGIRWTPDGKAVCYRDWINGIWRQEIAGGPPQRLKGLPEEKIYSFSWSHDGKSFAFTRGRAIRDAVLITREP